SCGSGVHYYDEAATVAAAHRVGGEAMHGGGPHWKCAAGRRIATDVDAGTIVRGGRRECDVALRRLAGIRANDEVSRATDNRSLVVCDGDLERALDNDGAAGVGRGATDGRCPDREKGAGWWRTGRCHFRATAGEIGDRKVHYRST